MTALLPGPRQRNRIGMRRWFKENKECTCARLIRVPVFGRGEQNDGIPQDGPSVAFVLSEEV